MKFLNRKIKYVKGFFENLSNLFEWVSSHEDEWSVTGFEWCDIDQQSERFATSSYLKVKLNRTHEIASDETDFTHGNQYAVCVFDCELGYWQVRRDYDKCTKICDHSQIAFKPLGYMLDRLL